MGKTRQRTYGKPVKQHMGYNIRTLLKDGKNPSGKFGVFAGKKMLHEVPNVEEGVNKINKIVTGTE